VAECFVVQIEVWPGRAATQVESYHPAELVLPRHLVNGKLPMEKHMAIVIERNFPTLALISQDIFCIYSNPTVCSCFYDLEVRSVFLNIRLDSKTLHIRP